jgi:hypothetical protein
MYNASTYKVPFWAENSGFLTGRDALGIQNSSITVYAKLLPGLTNLTQRLRYYGFYCWLLKEYEKNSFNSNNRTLDGQYNFVRRAELIMAFLMVNTSQDQLNVVGSDFANKYKNDVEGSGFYDIKLGADKFNSMETANVYWDFNSGALGQYYAGSLSALGLIGTSERFFVLDKGNGLKLANAFENSIDENTRNVFLSAIDSGKLTISDIQILEGFGLQKILENSTEWNTYIEILIGDDGVHLFSNDKIPSTNRKETIKLYLEFLKNNPKDIDFVAYQYELSRNELGSCNANFGWYYYFINECFHYAIESIFWVFLAELEGNPIPVQTFFDSITDLAVMQLSNRFNIQPNQKLEDVLTELKLEDLIEVLKTLEGQTKSKSNSQIAIGTAFILIFQTYKNISSRLDEISEFEKLNRITDQNGHVSENSRQLIISQLDICIKDYVAFTIKLILNAHISTAYRKMGNGESNLLKFLIEDDLIMHIQTMYPNHTTPRISALRNFLIDLKLITRGNELTNWGEDLLNRLQVKNDR